MPRMPTHRMPATWVTRVGSPTPPEARLLSLSGVRRAPTSHAARGALGRAVRTAHLPLRTRPATELPRRLPRPSTAALQRPCGLRRPPASRGGVERASSNRRTRASKALGRGPGRYEQNGARPRGAARSRQFGFKTKSSASSNFLSFELFLLRFCSARNFRSSSISGASRATRARRWGRRSAMLTVFLWAPVLGGERRAPRLSGGWGEGETPVEARVCLVCAARLLCRGQ